MFKKIALTLLSMFTVLMCIANNDSIVFVNTDTSCLIVPANNSISCDTVIFKKNNKKKLVAALFAFPFPFGFVGAHRIVLETKPWVPVVYVTTFGGCFGVLPLIDFFTIVFSKDIESYEKNPNVFMWLKD